MNTARLEEIKRQHPAGAHQCPHCLEYCCADGGWHAESRCTDSPCDEYRLVADVETLLGIKELWAQVLRNSDGSVLLDRSSPMTTALDSLLGIGVEKCGKCDGCGKVANTEGQEPWSAWMNLPLSAAAMVVAGVVRPIDCPACGGSGRFQVQRA